MGHCKECTKNSARVYRSANLERMRAYDRKRSQNPERRKANAEVSKIWRSQDKRRHAAHEAVRKAILRGTIVRKSCVRCGSEKSVAHHDDYERKLDVTWLCQPCHKQRHKELNALLPTN